MLNIRLRGKVRSVTISGTAFGARRASGGKTGQMSKYRGIPIKVYSKCILVSLLGFDASCLAHLHLGISYYSSSDDFSSLVRLDEECRCSVSRDFNWVQDGLCAFLVSILLLHPNKQVFLQGCHCSLIHFSLC